MLTVSRIYRSGAEFAECVASGFMPDGRSRSDPGVADELRRYGNSLNSRTDFLRVLCVSAVNTYDEGSV